MRNGRGSWMVVVQTTWRSLADSRHGGPVEEPSKPGSGKSETNPSAEQQGLDETCRDLHGT